MIHPANKPIPTMGEEAEELLRGITLDWVRTEFTLPKSIASQCEPYFLRMWEGSFAYSQVLDGVMEVNGNKYIVHWQSTPEVARNSERVACSFRGYKGKNYVVIKVWKQTESGE